MRKLTTFFLLFTLLASVQAAPAFVKGGQYRMACRQYNASGAIVTGAAHSSQSPLVYLTNGTTADDGYWTIESTDNGHYTIRNVKTLQYITYDGVYGTNRRYVTLTDAPNGSSSEWDFEYYDGYYVIRRADNPKEVFNVRSGTYIVGTYEASLYESNEQFLIYDGQGNKVEEKGASSGVLTEWITLALNDKAPVYDSKYGQLMHTIPEECLNGYGYTATVTYTPTTEDEGLTLYIDGTPVASGSDYTFDRPEGGRTYTLTVQQGDEERASLPITFTSLPIVEINGNFSSTYSQGSIRVNQWFSPGIDSLYNAKLKWRGATAMSKPKKSYAVKLQDENLESKDVSFLGLREDNNWILDAAYIDMSRTRNRVSTDLWNDFSAEPYYKAQEPKLVNGTRGQFVEVLLNGEYNGIYCMTEKVDRKQLKLKKINEKEDGIEVRGCLYKSDQWSYSVMMGHYPDSRYYPQMSPTGYNNNSMTWDSWEMKYPDLEDGEPIDWSTLYNAVNFVATSNATTFVADVDKYFDMPLLRDYYLLIELTLATDNHGKNLYWHCYNQKKTQTTSQGKEAVRMCLTPWDMDGTWGRRWDGSSTYTRANQDFVNFLWSYEHGEFTLYKRLKELDYKNWTDTLALRYALLRQGAFHEDSLVARFTRYYEQFVNSGAELRETERWVSTDAGLLDFDSEQSFLTQWIHDRLAYLDEQYDIENVLSTVKVEDAQARLTVSGGQGRILIESTQPRRTTLYNTAGVAVRQLELPAGVTEVRNLTKGLYVIDGHKVLVK